MVVTLGLLLASGGWGSGMLLSTPQYPGWPLPLPAETYPAPDVSGADIVTAPAPAFPAFGEGMGTQAQACREETDPEEHRLPLSGLGARDIGAQGLGWGRGQPGQLGRLRMWPRVFPGVWRRGGVPGRYLVLRWGRAPSEGILASLSVVPGAGDPQQAVSSASVISSAK